MLIAAAVVLGAWIVLREDTWIRSRSSREASRPSRHSHLPPVLVFCGSLNLRRASEPGEMFVRMIQGLGAASIALALLYFWFPSLMMAAVCSW